MFTTSQDAFGVDQLQSWPTPIIFINTMSFPALAPNGSITNPSYSFAAQTDMGIYRAGASDMRVAMNSQDIVVFTRVTFGSLTNASSFGIGTIPQRPFHCKFSSNTAGGIWVLENTDTTNANGALINWRTTTTGAGSSAFVDVGTIGMTVTQHNHTTVTSQFAINILNSAVAEAWTFSAGYVLQNATGDMTIQTGGGNGSIFLSPNGTGFVTIDTAKKLRIRAGTNQRAADATLVAGTVTIANTTVTANTRVLMNVKTIGGTPGTLSFTLNAGVGFTINSSNAADTSTVSFFLYEVL